MVILGKNCQKSNKIDTNEEFILKVDDDISLQIIKFIDNKLAENTESLVKNITNCLKT